MSSPGPNIAAIFGPGPYGVCHKCPQQSSVIAVGIHADLLTQLQLTRQLTHLRSIAEAAISHQKLISILALNVTKAFSGEMDQFMYELCRINNDVLSLSPPISMMRHMVLAFLKQKIPNPDVDAIPLSDLIAYLKADLDELIHPDSTDIVPILKILSEKGLVFFIPSENPLNSWIVLRKASILKKINGALFADPSLKEYIHVASNTGIVPKEVELSEINTNMAPEGSPSSDHGPLLFVPVLVSVKRPSSARIPKNSFGWSMIVKCTNQFFTTRCLHVLLDRLPSMFALPSIQATPTSYFHCICDIWSRGVKWHNETGVTTIVEMSETIQSLSLAMSSPDRRSHKYLNLVHAVVAVIKAVCQEFCPYVEVIELISCPPEASSDLSDGRKVQLSSLTKALLEGDTHLADVDSEKYVVMEEWMKIEPHIFHSLLEVRGCAVIPTIFRFDQTSCSGVDRRVNIAEQIGVNYLTFGMFLLQDSFGAIVKALENEHQRNAERINLAIRQKWLEGKGLKPVTWASLVSALQ
eukprot:Em0001g993a